MARTDTLGNFLTDVATAIREKKGTTDTIPASNFDTEISSIQTGASSPITKGIIINACDESGFATDVSIVGMTTIPPYYLQKAAFGTASSFSKGWMYSVKGNLHLPNNLEVISMCAFDGCNNLALTELPDTVTQISNYAFRDCYEMLLTKLPANLTLLGEYAFYGCKKLTSLIIPAGITQILTQCFYQCSFLESVTFEGDVTIISDSSFRDCKKLNFTELPNTIATIGSYAFHGCSSLSLTKLPDSLTSLKNYAFASCTSLTKVEVPAGVTLVTNSSFRTCTGLTELTYKGDITSFEIQAFYGDTSLAKIVLPNVTSVPTLTNTNVFYNTPIAKGTGLIYVPDTLVDSFKTATNWSTYADQIKPISELEASA